MTTWTTAKPAVAAPTITHAWNGNNTACGLTGSGLLTGLGDWSGPVVDRCPKCTKATT